MAPEDTRDLDIDDDSSLLNETVQTLSKMIKDLEKQLGKMLEVNEALEQDLGNERKKRAKVEKDHISVKEQLKRTEDENVSLQDLRVEIGHLGRERSRLASSIEELGRQLSDSEQEARKFERLSDRMRSERDDTIEELQSVEAQFDHAVEIIADLKTRVDTLAEERDAIVARLKVIDGQLEISEEQRDSLKKEVEESKEALDDIRRSVADACVLSQRFYYQQEEHDELE